MNRTEAELRMQRLLIEEQEHKVRKAKAEADAAELILKATQDGARSLGVLVPKVPS